MQVSTATAATVNPPLPAPSPTSPASPDAPDATADPAVIIDLSPQAQAVVDGSAPAPATPAPPQDVWSGDAVAQALAALNDTSGQTSVTDQLGAYQLINGLIADPKSFDTSAERTDGASVTAAFETSAYAQHLQDVFSQIMPMAQQTRDDLWTPSSLEAQLGAFNALSADDQQTFVGALNMQQGMVYNDGKTPFASVDAYVANQSALIGVMRQARTVFADPSYAPPSQSGSGFTGDSFRWQVQSITTMAQARGDQATVDLMGLITTNTFNDGWTQKAQGHFTAYGDPPSTSPPDGPLNPSWWGAKPGYSPPSGQDLAGALAAVNDQTGKTPLQDQLGAYNLLRDYTANAGDFGPGRLAIVKNWEASPFTSRVNTATSAADDWLPSRNASAAEISKTSLSRLNRLSAGDQQIVFNQHNQAGAFASLDSYKANISARGAAGTILATLLAQNHADQLSDIDDPKLTATARFQALLKLYGMGVDQQNDAWTNQAQAAVAMWSSKDG